MPRHERIPGHEVKKQQFTNHCFGCGPANEAGLRLKFVLDKKRERFLCRFRLQRRFVGPPAHAHGGIIATILDEAMGKVNKLHNLVALTSQMEITCLLENRCRCSGQPLSKDGKCGSMAASITARPRFAMAKAKFWPAARRSSSRSIRTACLRVSEEEAQRRNVGRNYKTPFTTEPQRSPSFCF